MLLISSGPGAGGRTIGRREIGCGGREDLTFRSSSRSASVGGCATKRPILLLPLAPSVAFGVIGLAKMRGARRMYW